MLSKTKRVFWGFFSFDYKAMEIYLEEMAEKGWMLEKVGGLTAKFRAIEPKKLKFCVDVFKKGGPFTPENTIEAQEYRKQCEKLGWTFITSQNYLQFFYADADNVPAPIQTDEAFEHKIVETTLWRNEMLAMLVSSVVAIIGLTKFFPVSYKNFLSFIGVTGTIFFPMLCVFMFAYTIYGLIRVLKARRNIKKGLPIGKPSLKSARRRIIVFHVPVLIIGIIFILSLLGDALYKPHIVGLSILGPVFGLSVGYCLRYFIKKKAAKEDGSALYITIAVIVVAFFIIIVNSLFANILVSNTYRQDSIPEAYPIVSMEELLEGSEKGILESREFDHGMSPIIPEHYNYRETRYINGKTESIRIKYYKAINRYFADIIFNGIKEELEKGFKWKGMNLFTKTIIKDDEMRDLWNVDNLVLTKGRDEIIVQKGNTVVHISGDIDFNDKRTSELIYSKLLLSRF